MMTTIIESIRQAVPPGWKNWHSWAIPCGGAVPTCWRFRTPHLQRTDRSHQRAPGSPAPQRPRVPQPHPLPMALTTTQRRTPHTHQRTLNYEEPVMSKPFRLSRQWL
jgi:hypothetical protein